MQFRNDWLSLTVFALSCGGILLGLAATFGLIVLLLFDVAIGDTVGALGIAWAAASVGTVSVLGVPMAYWTGRKVFTGKEPARGRPAAAWGVIAILFPLAIVAGYLASELEILPGFLGPAAQVLAAGIPAALIAIRVLRTSEPVTPTRAWGHVLMGLWASPILALALEAVLLVGVGIILFIGLAVQPGLQETLSDLSKNPALSEESLLEDLAALILNPWTVGCILAYIAVLVPLLEEVIKLLGVAPFLRLPLTPSQAFLAGVLSGLGYALFEALFLPQPGTGWAGTMLARVGATLMHAFTAGLMGWAIAELAVRRKPGPILLAYPGAVAVHGLWNASAVAIGLAVVAAQVAQRDLTDPPYVVVAGMAVAVLVALTVGAALGIAIASRRFGPRTTEYVPAALRPELPGT